MELTVLGCSGSYGAPAGGACSGYLVRAGGRTHLDRLRQRLVREPAAARRSADLTAVVITHGIPTTASTSTGCTCMNRYGLERIGLPVYAPEGVEQQLEASRRRVGATRSTGSAVGDGDARRSSATSALRFSRTDHPPPTVAVEIAHDGKRLVYTVRHRARSGASRRSAPGADLVLSEATYQHDDIRAPIHLSARQAGEMARAAQARRLMLTHLWPTLDPVASVEEGSEAFGARGHARRAAPQSRTSDRT